MPPDGPELVACWREAGEWWSHQPYVEYRRVRDGKGVVREQTREYASLGNLKPSNNPAPPDDNREEWSLRIQKARDEKVAKACGYLPAKDVKVLAPTKSLPYAALHVSSGYSFGRGTMLAEEIPPLAAAGGIAAVALADRMSLTGAVEFARMANKVGVKPLIGASIEMPEGGEIVLIARCKQGYESLSQIVTACHLEQPRQFPLGSWEALSRHARGLICLTGGDLGPLNRLVTHGRLAEAEAWLNRLCDTLGHPNVFVEIERSYLPWEIGTNRRLLELAETKGLRAVAGGMVTHARPEHFPVQDVLVCADTLCLVDEVIGRKPMRFDTQPAVPPRPARALNAERYLRTSSEMAQLYSDQPNLIENGVLLAEMCDADVLPSRTCLPPLFEDSAQALREITLAGAWQRHGKLEPKLKKRIEYELDRIIRLNFASHFLTIWEACEWAREQNILFSGRGSVVDSAVAYCLGISRIDAYRHRLHFDRFLPNDGSKRPDIDIDFEANRRNDVRNYLTRKYGEDRVATVAAVGAYLSRGIVREVGKVLGLPAELVGYLAKRVHGGVSPAKLESALENRPELRGSDIPKERFQWVFALAERMTDIPRNMRAHSSGVVISSRPLAETVPVMWSAGSVDDEDETRYIRIIQWDKRSAKYYFDKFDILCLRGQDVLSGTQTRIRAGNLDFNVEQIPLDDEETYRAMRSGELIGIPQSASPAMRQAHIRLRTENLHDASLVQAGIRPGVGGAVKINELIARRRGKPYSFEHPDLEKILGLTYGIIVFQEQVDQLLQTFAGYTSGEAEDIRERIHEMRREDYGQTIRDEMMARILANGYSPAAADRVFDYVAGFKGYGFAQGHALAFAEISIRSIYCQQNFPAPYFAALLDAQPAGYYGPCTIANEARCRGVAMLPVDVNQSGREFRVEDVKSAMDPKIVLPDAGIRVALRQISGISSGLVERIRAPYRSFFHFVAETKPERDELERLILCGALDSLCDEPNRRAMLWAIPAAQQYMHAMGEREGRLPFDIPEPEIDFSIADFTQAEKAVFERTILGMDVAHHLMAFERERVAERGGITSREARLLPNKRKAIVVGNPIRLRFPPTQSGKRVVFFDLEDETGLLNVTCFDDVYQRDGHTIICSPYVTLIGEAQDRDGHSAFLAHRVFPYRPVLGQLSETQPIPIKTADFLVG